MQRGEINDIIRIRILKWIYEEFKKTDKPCRWTDIRKLYNSDRAVREQLDNLIKEKFVLPVKIENNRKSKKLNSEARNSYLFNSKKEEEAKQIFQDDFVKYKNQFEDYKVKSEKEIKEKQSFLEMYGIDTLSVILLIIISIGIIYTNLTGYPRANTPIIYAYSENGNCTLVVDKVDIGNKTFYIDEACKIILNESYRKEKNISLNIGTN